MRTKPHRAQREFDRRTCGTTSASNGSRVPDEDPAMFLSYYYDYCYHSLQLLPPPPHLQVDRMLSDGSAVTAETFHATALVLTDVATYSTIVLVCPLVPCLQEGFRKVQSSSRLLLGTLWHTCTFQSARGGGGGKIENTMYIRCLEAGRGIYVYTYK